MSKFYRPTPAPEENYFFQQAKSDLERIDLTHDILPQAARIEPRWHPNGFIVYHLQTFEAGNLRLHIWPSGKREFRLGAPSSHSHPWHLVSRVLTGIYREVTYKEAPNLEKGDKTVVYLIDYDANPNRFTDSETVYVNPEPEKSFTKGEYHEIEAGVMHRTTIPLNDFVATLMLTSHQVQRYAAVAMGGDLSSETYVRPSVFRDTQTTILSRLELALGATRG